MVILKKIRKEMEVNHCIASYPAPLSGFTRQINESSHHVSQAINEGLNKSYFELLLERVG